MLSSSRKALNTSQMPSTVACTIGQLLSTTRRLRVTCKALPQLLGTHDDEPPVHCHYMLEDYPAKGE